MDRNNISIHPSTHQNKDGRCVTSHRALLSFSPSHQLPNIARMLESPSALLDTEKNFHFHFLAEVRTTVPNYSACLQCLPQCLRNPSGIPRGSHHHPLAWWHSAHPRT